MWTVVPSINHELAETWNLALQHIKHITLLSYQKCNQTVNKLNHAEQDQLALNTKTIWSHLKNRYESFVLGVPIRLVRPLHSSIFAF